MCCGCQKLGQVSSESCILRGRDIMYHFEMDRYYLYPNVLDSDKKWFLELGRETYECCGQQE
jgi:hypothetical protein